MFTDIRRFSRISDQLRAHKDIVAEFLQSLYATTVACAHAHGGIVDKFMGDGSMLLFGAFDSDPSISNSDHARRACRAALQLQAEVSPLIDKFLDAARRAEVSQMPRLSLGIGINTALALVGIIRTQLRDQYTALGHGVNLAQRFESAAGKETNLGKGKKRHIYGDILITSSVQSRVQECFEVKGEPSLKDIHNVLEEHPVWSVVREKSRYAA